MIVLPEHRVLDKAQGDAMRIAHDYKYLFGLFSDAGWGKTLVAARMINPIRRRSFFPALIFCRRDDYLTWRLELMREGVSEDDMFFIDHKEEWATRKDAKGEYWDHYQQEFPDEPKQWNFVTYDLVKGEPPKTSNGKRNKRSRAINFTQAGEWVYEHQYKFEIVAGDELQMIKCWDSYRTQVVHKLIKPIPRRIGMTATPETNELTDSFSIGLFCDRGKTFGTSYWKFLDTHFIVVKGAGWFPKKDIKEVIRRKMAKFSYRAEIKVDVEHREPIIKGVAMLGKQRRLYEQVLNNWELELDDGRVMEYKYVMSKIQKLKQIASGFYYDDKGKAHRLPNQKIKLLEEHFKDPEYFLNRNKIILYGSYREEIDMLYELMEKLNITAIKYNMTTRKQKEEARLAFAHQPEIKAFIINQEKAVGMDELKVANTALYFSRSYKVVAAVQSAGRTKRKGSEMHDFLEYYDYMTEKTVDPLIYNTLLRKVNVARYVMELAKANHSVRRITS